MRSRKSPDSGAGMTSPPTHQNRLPRISIPDSAQHKSALASTAMTALEGGRGSLRRGEASRVVTDDRGQGRLRVESGGLISSRWTAAFGAERKDVTLLTDVRSPP